jgi:hypothetical protein
MQCPASACDTRRRRTPCTHAPLGHGWSVPIRADEPLQQKRRAQISTTRGRASRRKRKAVDHVISHQSPIKAGEPGTKGCRQISLTAVVMQR